MRCLNCLSAVEAIGSSMALVPNLLQKRIVSIAFRLLKRLVVRHAVCLPYKKGIESQLPFGC